MSIRLVIAIGGPIARIAISVDSIPTIIAHFKCRIVDSIPTIIAHFKLL